MPSGEIVYDPARPVSVLFIVKSGRFRLFRTVPDGRTVTTARRPWAWFRVRRDDLLGLRMGATWAEAMVRRPVPDESGGRAPPAVGCPHRDPHRGAARGPHRRTRGQAGRPGR
ncbi:hypothetical protein HBB16_09980 [Pseudonocardia sp. MCCB 268]|nr:hypothetical protein [Pseudonocardia cytotoxica]